MNRFMLRSLPLLLLSVPALALAVPGVAGGPTIYKANCAACHGAKGKGGIGPALSDASKWSYALFSRALLKGTDDYGSRGPWSELMCRLGRTEVAISGVFQSVPQVVLHWRPREENEMETTGSVCRSSRDRIAMAITDVALPSGVTPFLSGLNPGISRSFL
jgi:hypothetical protein